MSNFKIVVNGDVLPGFELDTVKENIAKLFKLVNSEAREKTFAKIFSGNPMVIKKGLSQQQAKAYKMAMNKAGLGYKIELETPATGLGLEPVQTPAATPIAASPTELPTRVAAASPTPAEKPANPYAPPTADLETPAAEGGFTLVEPQKISAGGGIDWIKEGYYHFKQAPLGWIGMVILYFIIVIVLSVIPLVSLVVNIINPVFIGGFMIACYRQTQNEPFSVGDLFAGFKTNFGRLAAVGAIYLVSLVIIVGGAVGLMFAMMGQEMMAMMAQTPDPSMILAKFSMFFLLLFGLMSLVMMAYIFAPVLIVMHDVTAVAAMKLSFKGCWRNMLPFLVYGLAAMLLSIVAMIPLGLGLLILMPVMTASIFAAYRQIFTE